MKVLEGTLSPWGKQELDRPAEVTSGYVLCPCLLSVLLLFLFFLYPATWPLTSIRNGEDKSYLFVCDVLVPEELLEHPQPDTDCLTIVNFRPSSLIYIYGELYYTRH